MLLPLSDVFTVRNIICGDNTFLLCYSCACDAYFEIFTCGVNQKCVQNNSSKSSKRLTSLSSVKICILSQNYYKLHILAKILFLLQNILNCLMKKLVG